MDRICIFVRHGESQSNINHTWSDEVDRYPLTEGGAIEVDEAAKKLSRIRKFAGFYSSPILRARQTAEIISKRIRMEPEITELLKERGFGKYNNMSFKDAKERRGIVRKQIEEGYPEWESWQSMIDRITEFSRALKPGISIAVTHMDPIRPLITSFRGGDEPSMFDVRLDNASFNIIDFDKTREEAILAIDGSEIPERLG